LPGFIKKGYEGSLANIVKVAVPFGAKATGDPKEEPFTRSSTCPPSEFVTVATTVTFWPTTTGVGLTASVTVIGAPASTGGVPISRHIAAIQIAELAIKHLGRNRITVFLRSNAFVRKKTIVP
jgi:hypothetical protein